MKAKQQIERPKEISLPTIHLQTDFIRIVPSPPTQIMRGSGAISEFRTFSIDFWVDIYYKINVIRKLYNLLVRLNSRSAGWNL